MIDLRHAQREGWPRAPLAAATTLRTTHLETEPTSPMLDRTRPRFLLAVLATALLLGALHAPARAGDLDSEPVEPTDEHTATDTAPTQLDGPSDLPADPDDAPDAPVPADESSTDASPEPASRAMPEPLDPAVRERFFASPEDPRPRKLERAAHFWAGNEAFLYVFEPDVRDLGGGYVGVGSDQNYLFIGWQRPELAWLTDYDQAIQRVHRVHRVFFLAASTPKAFVNHWTDPSRGRKAVEKAYAGDPELAALLEVYEKSQPLVVARLRAVRKEFDDAGMPCYLNDQDTYDFLVAMWQTDRIRPMLGNLLDAQALTGIGEAARELGIPVRVAYLSNAEQYWDYPEQFRANFRALHFDDKSIIVRTLAMGDRADDYKYNVHPAANFNEWLAQSWLESVWQLKRDWTTRHGLDFSYSTLSVDDYLAQKDERDEHDKLNEKAIKTQVSPKDPTPVGGAKPDKKNSKKKRQSDG